MPFPLAVYGSRWRAARLRYLRANPLCRYCEEQGRLTGATVVDHIRPHKGDVALFWDTDNWQPLCTPCHDRIKRLLDERGQLPGSGLDGVPLDPNHHWRG